MLLRSSGVVTPLRDHESLLEVDRTSLWTATRGKGPPVVLLHGGPGVCDYLAPVAEMLEDVATVHRYEQRGCGRSREHEPITIDALIADLDELRRIWGHARVSIVGHSWGATLGLLYALRHSEAVTRLVYACGVGITNDWKPEYRRARGARLTRDEQERWDALAERESEPAADAEAMELLIKTDFADPARLSHVPRPLFAFPTNHRVNAALNLEWDRLVSGGQLRDRVRTLAVPALFLHGDRDPRPAWPARELAELVGARFVVLEDVGHEPFWERPEPFRQELRSFLT